MKYLEPIPYGDIVNLKFICLNKSQNYKIENNYIYVNDIDFVKRISIVLRTLPKEKFVINFLEDKSAFLVNLESITKKRVQFNIKNYISNIPSKNNISFILSPIKNYSKYEEMIKMISQLGMDSVCFLKTLRSQFNIKDNKILRLKKVISNFSEISKRIDTLDIKVINFDDLKYWNEIYLLNDKKIDCFSHSFFQQEVNSINFSQKVAFIIGPEGGFSDSDVCIFKKIPNIRTLSLGNFIFKSEFVPIYISSVCHFILNKS